MKLTMYARDVEGNEVELSTTYPPFTVKEAEDFVRKTGAKPGEFTALVDDRDPTTLRWLWIWFHSRNGVDIAWGDADFDLTSYVLRIEREPGEPGYVADGDNEVGDEGAVPTTSGQEGGETAA
jgi:hypothetical protein